MKLEIRKCEVAEAQAVGEFYDRVVADLCANINYPKWTYKVYPSVDFVREMTLEGSQYICLNAGVIVGAFVFNGDPQGEYENATWGRKLQRGEYGVCHAVAIATALQGKGLGKQIVEYCIELAKKLEYKAIRLDVVPSNLPARKLYEKCGFRYVGDADLERGYEDIPLFSLLELNF
ncbi:MAG: N-acetyltransferase [Clostridiales bacterium]|nr:N-acetyltransferase [Clostridiales bacterium]